MPQDKVEAVRRLEARGRRVLVVGDGINDAPALAAAHRHRHGPCGLRPRTPETADAVIVRDELATVPKVIALSRAARTPGGAEPRHRRSVRLRPWSSGTWRAPCHCRSASSVTKARPSSSASTGCACCGTPPGTAPRAGRPVSRRAKKTAPARERPGPPSRSAAAAAAAPRAKIPYLNHEAQLTDLRTQLAGVAMVRRTDCLDACERCQRHRHPALRRGPQGRRTSGLARAGSTTRAPPPTSPPGSRPAAPGLAEPPGILDLYTFSPSRRVRHELDED